LFDKGLLVANLYQTYAYLLTQSDSDGTITTAELGSVMRAVGRNPTEQDLQDILKDIDKDNSGSIEFDEFVELMERTFTDQGTPDEFLQAFNVFDKDGSGNISLSELGQVMESLG
jgi:calmodulin